jgi:hypothetical protein
MGMGRPRPVLLEHRGEGAPARPDSMCLVSARRVKFGRYLEHRPQLDLAGTIQLHVADDVRRRKERCASFGRLVTSAATRFFRSHSSFRLRPL